MSCDWTARHDGTGRWPGRGAAPPRCRRFCPSPKRHRGDRPALGLGSARQRGHGRLQSGHRWPPGRRPRSRPAGRPGPHSRSAQVQGIDVNVLRLWITASADPIGRRNQLLPSLRTIVGSPVDEPSWWRVASAAWLLENRPGDHRAGGRHAAVFALPACAAQGGLTVLDRWCVDTGRWDEALESSAAEAARRGPGQRGELVAASADVISRRRPRPSRGVRSGPLARLPGARRRRPRRMRGWWRPRPGAATCPRPRRRHRRLRPLRGYLGQSEGPGPWPGIVMIHELFGLNKVMRGHAEPARPPWLPSPGGRPVAAPAATRDAWSPR